MYDSGGPARTRVGVLPAAHPAVRRITGLDGLDHIELVPVRASEVGREDDPLRGVDLAHMHIGYDYLSPEGAGEVVRHLDERGIPLVLTVHDIVYPREEDALPHRRHTGTMVRAARSVITLTGVAAHELWVRWGVDAVVVPHPRLLSELEISAAVRSSRHVRAPNSTVVGVLLERMGENIEGPELLDLLDPVSEDLPGAHLRIVVEAQAWRQAWGEDLGAHDQQVVGELAAEGGWGSVRLVQYETGNLGPLLPEFAALDVCVLPYRFATHSSWLELCRDLGVAPVFPPVGFLREQWFDRSEPGEHSGEIYDPRDPGSLARSVRTALATPYAPPPRIEGADSGEVMAAHGRVYRRVISR